MLRPTKLGLVLALLVVLGLASCVTEPPPLSLDEARRTVAQFQEISAAPSTTPPGEGTQEFLDRIPEAVVSDEIRLQAEADPPAKASTEALIRFYLDRARARRKAGLPLGGTLEDLHRARDLAQSSRSRLLPVAFFEIYWSNHLGGTLDRALDALESAVAWAEAIQPINYWQIATYNGELTTRLLTVGRLGDAEKAAEAAISAAQQYVKLQGVLYLGDRQRDIIAEIKAKAFRARAEVLGAAGRYREEEQELRNAIDARLGRPTKYNVTMACQYGGDLLARNLINQGRLMEAEAEARNGLACLSSPSADLTAERLSWVTGTLAQALDAQGRLEEAEIAQRKRLDFLRRTGSKAVGTSRYLAGALAAQERWPEAREAFAVVEAGYAGASLANRAHLHVLVDWHLVQIKAGAASRSLESLAPIISRYEGQFGPNHWKPAQFRAIRGMALTALDQKAQAREELARAIPILLAANTADGGQSALGPRNRLIRYAIDTYLVVLTDLKGTEAAAEAFILAQQAGGRETQRALAQAGARAALHDPRLAEIVRDEQDASQSLAAMESLIASRSGAGDAGSIDALQADAAKLRAARDVLRKSIQARFPSYADLIDPKALDVAATRAALKPGQVHLFVHVGSERTWIWAIPRSGAIGFRWIDVGKAEIETRVGHLRRAFIPTGPDIGDIPDFDVVAAHDLYRLLLGPFEALLSEAQTLVTVADGPLATLPFTMLVTAPHRQPITERLLFASYRDVPWLVKKVAIAQVPTIASLATLSTIPASQSNRNPFIGFGDPIFSKSIQMKSPAKPVAIAMRAVRRGTNGPLGAVTNQGVDVGALAPLPDTADELRDIARVLGGDPDNDVFLGVRANKDTVRNSDLMRRKVVAFATHGLVPGDIAGLGEPALALTPGEAGGAGNGLLTMSDVAGLKLDADWVVLSACNTAQDKGLGVESVAGLSRAFFYAGARSVLITHWAVETTSARALTTSVFDEAVRRPTLGRAQHLQQSMLRLIETGAFTTTAGRAVFSYAHPFFWAPFALVGDPG